MDLHSLDDNIVDRAILLPHRRLLHRVQHIHPINDPRKDRILIIQVLMLAVRNKELAAIRARPPVGHGHNAAPIVLERGVELICQEPAPNAFAALARARGVPALHHELADVAVKKRILIGARRGQCQEVLAEGGRGGGRGECVGVVLWEGIGDTNQGFTSHVRGTRSQYSSSLMLPRLVCSVTAMAVCGCVVYNGGSRVRHDDAAVMLLLLLTAPCS